MAIKKVSKYVNEEGFTFNFEPIEDSLTIKETSNGYEARYLVRDEYPERPDQMCDDNSLFLVNYHRDFYMENKIIGKKEVKEWHQTGKLPSAISRNYHIFKLSCLVHSGVWLSLSNSFDCVPGGWDTSHVGLVFVGKNIAKTRKEALELADSLVKEWNQYLTGDVYGCVREVYNKNKEQIDVDSCWGFYGYNYALNDLQSVF